MNQADIAQLAASVGFPDPALAAAIAMGESSGNPNAYNGRGDDQSYGLWQINMKGSLGPARRAQFGLTSNEQLYDPVTNARIAVAIFNQQGYGAWGAYTNGSYRRFMGSASGTAGGGDSGASPLPSFQPIDTPFGPINPLWIGAGILIYFLLR